MKRLLLLPLLCLFLSACEREAQKGPEEPEQPQEQPACSYKNASVSYLGDDIGEGYSDAWIIKLWSDMESDEFGNLQGPGEIVQLLLNAYYNPDQELNYSFLRGKYSPMSNSGSFPPYSFVPGYQTTIPAPGGRLTVYDGSYYGSLEEGSTDISYDLLDEGDFEIEKGQDDTLIIKGFLAGDKFRKRYIDWKGVPEKRNEAPGEIPSSTLSRDMDNVSFSQAQLKDEGDIMDPYNPSVRYLRLFLGDESLDLSSSKPKGDGALLRLHILVDMDWSVENGIPEGEYQIAPCTENGGYAKEDLVPGRFLSGNPGYFNEPYISGAWYIEWQNSIWTRNYACFTSGSLKVENAEGGQKIIYELYDCLETAHRFSGSSLIKDYILL
ncbi:MAG: hypothetical protein ACI3ZF_00925 [Candidatus Cryptobacteroides sp.]